MLTKKMCPQLHFTFSGLPMFLKSEKLITLVLPHFSHIRVPFSLSLTYIFLTSIEHFSFLETTSTYRSHATRGYIQSVSDRNRTNNTSAILPASRRQRSRESCFQVGWLEANAHIECSKQGIQRTGRIKTHFVDELFKDQWIISKQADAPFPVVQTDGATDDLRHFAGVLASDHAVPTHELPTLVHRERIPVVRFTAFLIHRVKTQVLSRWHNRIEACVHGSFLVFELLLIGCLIRRRTRFHPAGGKLPLHRANDFIETKFDHRQIAVDGL